MAAGKAIQTRVRRLAPLPFFRFFMVLVALVLASQLQTLKETKELADLEESGKPRGDPSKRAEQRLKAMGIYQYAQERWPNLARAKRPASAPPGLGQELGGDRVQSVRRSYQGGARDFGASSIVSVAGPATWGGRPLGTPAGVSAEEASTPTAPPSAPAAPASAPPAPAGPPTPATAGGAMLQRLDAGMQTVEGMSRMVTELSSSVAASNELVLPLMRVLLRRLGEEVPGGSGAGDSGAGSGAGGNGAGGSGAGSSG